VSLLKKPIIIDVVENDMCIGCGACIYTCPSGVIEPVFNDERKVREVKVTDFDTCKDCMLCDEVCPSIHVDFSQLLQKPVKREGDILSISIGYSSEHQFNNISSSGGIIRALVLDALKHQKPVICLGTFDDTYNAVLLKNPEDLSKVPGSIYHSVSFSECIKLLKSLDKPCVLVAIPCHLEGLKNYIQKVEPALDSKIDLIVGLICGWMYTEHSLEAFAGYKGIKEKIHDAGYRGEDKVGNLKLHTDQKTHHFSRRVFDSFNDKLDYKASFSRYMNRLRCRVCEDHLNILSDITVGDAWLKRFEDEKLSIVVSRTDIGLHKIRELEKNGEITLKSGEFSDLIESQSDDIVYSHSAIDMNSYLRSKKRHAPKFNFDGKDQGSVKLGITKRLDFSFDMFMRVLIIRGKYKLYRILYFLRWVCITISNKWKKSQ